MSAMPVTENHGETTPQVDAGWWWWMCVTCMQQQGRGEQQQQQQQQNMSREFDSLNRAQNWRWCYVSLADAFA